MISTWIHLRLASLLGSLIVLAAAAGCATTPPDGPSPSNDPRRIAEAEVQTPNHVGQVLTIAEDMVGAPYRYGGASPRGFDCSGLIYYAFRKAGISVPRTSSGQYLQSKKINLPDLEPGDLIFFQINRQKLSHVGIYAGNNRFIHAPASGKAVSYASLDDEYWRKRIVGAGRL